MRKQIFFYLLFIFLNLMCIWGHAELFRTKWPFTAWVSSAIHIIVVIFFPYKNVFTIKTTQSENEKSKDYFG
jgi:hypothetical protein